MNDVKTNVIIFIKKYKLFLIVFLILTFLMGIILYTNSVIERNSAPPISPSPTLYPTTSISQPGSELSAPPIVSNENSEFYETESEGDENLEDRIGFIRKMPLQDGTTLYEYNSGNPNRPDIVIRNNRTALFQRIVGSEKEPILPISLMRETYGDPISIIQGTQLYGQDSVRYIYDGMAFIGNEKTDEVFEQHIFTSISLEDYMKRYADY